MVCESKKIILLLSLVFFAGLFAVNFVSAWVDCWQYGPYSIWEGDQAFCEAQEGGDACRWETPLTDSWCMDGIGCCMMKGCMEFDGNQTACESSTDSYNCTWDPYMTLWYPNGSQGSPGGCMEDFSGDAGTWGGMNEGCWNNDGNRGACIADNSCKWTANSQNENPWCIVKTLSDAQNKNSLAATTDIGCCETSGCWIHDNNETTCTASTTFQGNCYYTNNSYGGGWCNTKSCSEITDETNCTYAKQNLMMPCEFNFSGTGLCEEFGGGGGGFSFYNDSDSCFSAGGWYNSTGDCVMPTGDFGVGGGGFMFAGDVHCWFADNQVSVCGNLTGCAYCVVGSGPNGLDNSSSNNICYNKQIGYCEGHVSGDTLYANANNTANLACTDINIKSACNYGPLPNCKWSNSSTTTGAYCGVGAKSEKKSAPPAQYCEDPTAKNNYTICMQLANDFMMPCKWQNTTYPYTNCTFNSNAVFGGSGGEMDFGVINSQFSCTSAGGTWQSEYYVDGEILKQDSWCEMTGMFNIDQGQGTNNKVNCDTSCWACEFQNNGTAWQNASVAEVACEASVAVGGQAGGCVWKSDVTAFNQLGWCDYPKAMEEGGSKDCNIECEGCNFMGTPRTACEGSMANNGTGCKWVNDTTDLIKGGYCVDKTKKTCADDCFSCYDSTSCVDNTTALDCKWDQTFNLCSPNGFTGEICFNGVDDDSDVLVDCADPDCGFDNFCGGSSFGGDCFSKTTQGTCNQTLAFGSLNCSWINDTWNPTGWCDMPGSNCWKFDNDLATCGATAGCTNESISMGSNAWCEMNMTLMDSSSCWQYSTEGTCSGNCVWKNNTWAGATGGWCDYAPFATCMDLNTSACSANLNCSWREDNYSMMGGWCDVACMNIDLNQAGCENATFGGLCQWKNMNATCQPETFMMMGAPGGAGGKTGCGQYDGNQTGCIIKNVTCTYKNDTYAHNNLSATEPSGWCMDKSEFEHFGDMGGNVIDLAMDSGNTGFPPVAESGVDKEVDILGIGMRVTDAGFDFGGGLLNVSETIMCNGFMIGSKDNPMAQKVQGVGDKTTKFYWYLDTDGISTGGCNAVNASGANLTGYDFMINYISRNTSNGVVETKQMMRCSGGTWNPTNALVTTSKMLSCGEIGGVMVAVSKQDLESFSEYNKTAVMKIFMSGANDSSTRTSPSDSVGPGYYTPGTIDFGFVDCSNPSNSKDPKCKNFQKFGYNVFEECKNGIDDDENGLVDCADPFCSFMPDCNGGVGFNFATNSNDTTSPAVMFSKVEKLADSAFVRIDTNEPSNLSLQFYKNDSTCKTLNITINDIGIGYQNNSNFKPFHSVDLIQSNLGYDLNNNTVYYYKITTCDPSGNCAVSACSNFTTKVTSGDKSFIFKIELPEDGNYTADIPAMNKTNYNFTESFGGVNYEVGIKTNTSVTKNMNMTIHCGDMAIGFFGMNLLNPTKIDLSNAFICDPSNDLMGMNSSLKKWNKLIDDMHLGAASDYVEITIPVAYSSSNILNWTDDHGTGGQDVDAYVSCSDGGSSNTKCKIPVSMGFSAYTITIPTPSSSSSSSSSSSGGGGGGATTTTTTNTTTDSEETATDDRALDKGDGDVVNTIKDKAEDIVNIIKGKWIYIIAGIILVAVIGGVVLTRRNADSYSSKNKLSNKVKVVGSKMNPNKVVVVRKRK